MINIKKKWWPLKTAKYVRDCSLLLRNTPSANEHGDVTCVNEPSTGCVDKDHTRLHLSDALIIDDMVCWIHQWTVQGQYVTLSQHFVKLHVLKADLLRHVISWKGVTSYHPESHSKIRLCVFTSAKSWRYHTVHLQSSTLQTASILACYLFPDKCSGTIESAWKVLQPCAPGTETLEYPDHCSTNISSAMNSDGFAMNLVTQKSREWEVSHVGAHVSLVNLARETEQQGHSVLGNGLRGVHGHPNNSNPMLSCSC